MRRLFLPLFFVLTVLASAQTLTVGSKKFTESYVLGEIAKKVLNDAGFQVDHRQGIGSTGIVWEALKKGDITIYPEYTGTITEEILKKPGLTTEQIQAELAKFGVRMSPELGFNDAYGLVMRKDEAAKLGITKISDLRTHPELKCGITHELLGRKDGWDPLLAKYGMNFSDVKAIDHGLGYEALAAGQTDVKDCYTTDAEIQKYNLVVLDDDLHFFPLYRAVYLYRQDMPKRAVDAIAAMAGTIKEPLMIAMNARASKDKAYGQAAVMYFQSLGQKNAKIAEENRWQKTLQLTGQHLFLVGVSLLLAIVISIPLGIVAAKPGTTSWLILSVCGVIQTIPSLALLALLVPISFFGTTPKTAIAALFLYSLLPIVRNTATGIQQIPPSLKESAEALGLSPGDRLRKIYLPMALPLILAGIKTSAVINVGTATIAALIGSGGLGDPIVKGLSLNDNPTILWGAVPAAVLALLVQLAFDLVDRAIVPKGLRLK
ncbi:MAG TPA: glycine betaine ABC transporter substrate-binding protein [Fimbriimonas sp.]|nr:glycine betaine ABC transporter substrate-binding protein [Fimbriimonas sp.]